MQIPHHELHTGMTVYYTYTKISNDKPYGPFKVIGRYRNYEGEHVTLEALEPVPGTSKVRTVLLDDDEDFGSPLFST